MDGFCDKNRDMLYNDLIDLAQYTNSKIIPGLFPESLTAADKRRPTSAGFKIRESINLLVDALMKCHPHYIRCIKPNDKKRANDYNNDMVRLLNPIIDFIHIYFNYILQYTHILLILYTYHIYIFILLFTHNIYILGL